MVRRSPTAKMPIAGMQHRRLFVFRRCRSSAQRADEETHHGASLHDCDAPAYDESSYQKLREVFPDQSEPISIRLMFERELRDGATPEAMIDAARTYNQLVDGEPPGIILAEFLRDRYWRDCRAISKFDALEKEAA